MRLDKFLKVSRIIKRRPIAKLVVDGGKVKLDGKVVKAAAEVKVGQILLCLRPQQVLQWVFF